MRRWRENGGSDVRWKTVPQTSGCDRKHSVADSGQTSTSNIQIPESLIRQNVIVVWIQCLLVDVIRYAGTLAPDHVGIVRHATLLVPLLEKNTSLGLKKSRL